MFRCHPLGDLSVALQRHHDTVYVLLDRPGHAFLEAEGGKRSFGNVWMLNGALIFKGFYLFLSQPLLSDVALPDHAGVLEGEQSIRAFGSVRSSLRYCERLGAFINCGSPTRLNNSLRPIIIAPSADLGVWSPLKDGTVLGRGEPSCKSKYTGDSQDTWWISGSAKDLVRVNVCDTVCMMPITFDIESASTNIRATRIPCTIHEYRNTQ
jgi:hypothetical protein